jgi:hypothetical protein
MKKVFFVLIGILTIANVWANKPELTGFWEATIEGEVINYSFTLNLPIGPWRGMGVFSVKDFNPETMKKSSLLITRDPGSMVLNGKFEGNKGYGHFSFAEDTSFALYLKKKVGVIDVSGEWMLQMFMVGMDKGYFSYLKKDFSFISRNQVRELAFTYISGDYVKRMCSMGLKNLSLDKLLILKKLKVDTIYIRNLRQLEFKPFTADLVIELKSQNVDLTLLKSFRKLEFDISVHDLIGLKSLHITPEYIEKMRENGYISFLLSDYEKLKNEGKD